MNKTVVLIVALTLSSCSFVTDALKSVVSDDGGFSVDAQVGSNDNKVKTGVGTISGKTNAVENDTDSGNITSDSGEWHIESGKEVNVTVYETSSWLYVMLGIMFIVSIFRPWLVRKLGGNS